MQKIRQARELKYLFFIMWFAARVLFQYELQQMEELGNFFVIGYLD